MATVADGRCWKDWGTERVDAIGRGGRGQELEEWRRCTQRNRGEVKEGRKLKKNIQQKTNIEFEMFSHRHGSS